MAIEITQPIIDSASDSFSLIVEKTFNLFDPQFGFLRASGEGGTFARPFGRDTMMSALHLTRAHELNPALPVDQIFPAVAFILLHTPEIDIPEAGIYRGKPPHEMGTKDQGFPERFGCIDEAGFGICCDSADGADRTLLTIFDLEERFPHHLQTAINQLAVKFNKPSHEVNYYVEMITEWAIKNTQEFEGSAFIGAMYDPKRNNIEHRGLNKQFWRDSEFSVTKEDGSDLTHPLYTAEEQALRWSALLRAGKFLGEKNPDLAAKALKAAKLTKEKFNQRFPYKYEDRTDESTITGTYIASAIDATGYQVRDVTCDEITLLSHVVDGEYFITDPELRRDIIMRSYRRLFDELGGFRTIDRNNHPQNIYHGPNSIWPHRQADIVYAIETEAQRIKDENPFWYNEYKKLTEQVAVAALRPLTHYNDPIELVIITAGEYDLFRTYCEDFDRQQESSRVQAFSGFSALYLNEYLSNKYQIEELDALVCV
ncbi:MAG: hypothetical protein PHQ59_00565 [Candidatus Daviesbacteria bacterium]|nr:hypothetical protein [Candidatus Daviesbacteria bacterium]